MSDVADRIRGKWHQPYIEGDHGLLEPPRSGQSRD